MCRGVVGGIPTNISSSNILQNVFLFDKDIDNKVSRYWGATGTNKSENSTEPFVDIIAALLLPTP